MFQHGEIFNRETTQKKAPNSNIQAPEKFQAPNFKPMILVVWLLNPGAFLSRLAFAIFFGSFRPWNYLNAF
jgi:hypothetical protein